MVAYIKNDCIRRRTPYKKIKAYLVENDISQRQIAEAIDRAPSAVNQKLNGTGGDFSLQEARILSKEFGVPRSYFFEIDVPKKEQNEMVSPTGAGT
jgi:transcriptional regulator with XRE-family HTH domain